jgi:hypothetical protein
MVTVQQACISKQLHFRLRFHLLQQPIKTYPIQAGAGNMQFYVDDKLAYQAPLPAPGLEIVGIAFGFNGAGYVKNIRL